MDAAQFNRKKATINNHFRQMELEAIDNHRIQYTVYHSGLSFEVHQHTIHKIEALIEDITQTLMNSYPNDGMLVFSIGGSESDRYAILSEEELEELIVALSEATTLELRDRMVVGNTIKQLREQRDNEIAKLLEAQ